MPRTSPNNSCHRCTGAVPTVVVRSNRSSSSPRCKQQLLLKWPHHLTPQGTDTESLSKTDGHGRICRIQLFWSKAAIPPHCTPGKFKAEKSWLPQPWNSQGTFWSIIGTCAKVPGLRFGWSWTINLNLQGEWTATVAIPTIQQPSQPVLRAKHPGGPQSADRNSGVRSQGVKLKLTTFSLVSNQELSLTCLPFLYEAFLCLAEAEMLKFIGHRLENIIPAIWDLRVE